MNLKQYKQVAKFFYKDLRGRPFELTDGQAEIFKVIFEPEYRRIVMRAITRYGKSDISSLALLHLGATRKEKILIIGPSKEQSSIIMNNLIEHSFDHPYLTSQLEIDVSLERLKRERSRNRLTFKNDTEIFAMTADADSVKTEGKNLMGFGATVILVDESPLIPDEIFSKILRMLGDDAEKSKLIQLGNPFFRNHFYNAFYQERYHKIIIKKEQALKEGRLTQEFLDEMKENMPPLDYQIFYDCEFPEGGAEDALIPWDWIELAMSSEVEVTTDAERQAGIDVARFGRDKTIYAFRHGGKVFPMESVQSLDTMSVVGWAGNHIMRDKPVIANVDIIGIGSGVYDRLKELNYQVGPINVGESPTTDEAKAKFHNQRAEMYWNLREWFKPDNGVSKLSIPHDNELKRELQEIRYKYSSERKIRIEDKEEMKKRLGRSPDRADALALAFFRPNKNTNFMEFFKAVTAEETLQNNL